MEKFKVIITVRGGIAEVEECPKEVEVEIIDYDNMDDLEDLED